MSIQEIIAGLLIMVLPCAFYFIIIKGTKDRKKMLEEKK